MTAIRLTQDNDPAEEAREHLKKNWEMMLAGLRSWDGWATIVPLSLLSIRSIVGVVPRPDVGRFFPQPDSRDAFRMRG